MRNARFAPILLAVVLASAPARAQQSPAPGAVDPQAVEFFETSVRPLLAAKCFECHGEKQQKGGLRLDSRAALLKGGDTGAALVPGDVEGSLFIDAVRYGQTFQMPPQGKLKPAEVAVLEAWVRQGAVWPDTAPTPTASPAPGGPLFTAEEKSFWAFQKPVEPPTPTVANTAWPISPLDSFILARLEGAGLAPAPPADKRALVRRATFDLIGLPPTQQEIADFLADDTSEAFARVVDRLLASPHYGERWGRHWLDVARYADSNGLDENLAQVNAFRYRDYTIAAFNKDKPYDLFLKEQIAGDLLPATGDLATDHERIVATGFLCLGAKMLAEDDPTKMEMDIIDEQLDTLGSAVLGMTLGCARCHDHKYDPVPSTDYYSLAGIFKSTKTMENFRVVAQWQERPLATREHLAAMEAHRQRATAQRDRIAEREKAANGALVQHAGERAAEYLLAAARVERSLKLLPPATEKPLAPSLLAALVVEAENFTSGNVLVDTANYGAGIGVILNKGELPNFAEYEFELPAAGAYQVELRLAAAEARPVRLYAGGVLIKADAAKIATGTWFPDTQAWSVETVAAFPAGRLTLRLECDGPFPHFDKVALVPRALPAGVEPSRLESLAQASAARGLNAAFLSQAVDYVRGKASLLAAADAFQGEPAGGAALDPASLPAELHEAARQATADAAGPFRLPPMPASLYPPETQRELTTLRDELAKIDQSKPPEPPHAMAVSEGQPQNVKVHIRGNHLTQGAEVPRRFPRILAGEEQTPIDAGQSGRLQFAEWLVRPDHPLTARVMVNRIWSWHFGEGLVRSPDNFGRLGERPTHPELLDWLATRFVAEKWSIKAMHRTIMLSATYRMSTAYNERAAEVDPENRLWWRMPRRRLEAEIVRDSLLGVAGALDETMEGSLLQSKAREYVAGTASVNNTNYETRRRSVYLPVVRSALYEVFQAFDFAEPSVPQGHRATTTVAPQALFMMNSPLAFEQAGTLAKLLLADAAADDAARVQTVYERAYGRPATAAETSRALAFSAAYEQKLAERSFPAEQRRERAWQGLCHALLAANEFLFVE